MYEKMKFQVEILDADVALEENGMLSLSAEKGYPLAVLRLGTSTQFVHGEFHSLKHHAQLIYAHATWQNSSRELIFQIEDSSQIICMEILVFTVVERENALIQVNWIGKCMVHVKNVHERFARRIVSYKLINAKGSIRIAYSVQDKIHENEPKNILEKVNDKGSFSVNWTSAAALEEDLARKGT